MLYKIHTIPCLGCGDSASFIVTEDQYDRYVSGEHVQRIFPDWSSGDREMLISGTCPKCWDEMWPDDEEEDDDDGYLSGDESADWRDSDKDWYPED